MCFLRRRKQQQQRALIHQPRNNICFDASNNDANNARENKHMKGEKKKSELLIMPFSCRFFLNRLPILWTGLLYALSDKILLEVKQMQTFTVGCRQKKNG